MSFLESQLLKTSSGRNIWILFAASHIVLLLMMTYTFPAIHTQIDTVAFDLRSSGYNMDTAQAIVNNLDQATTNLYLFPQLGLLDVLYPCLLALFLSSLFYRLTQITRSKNKWTTAILLLPFLAMLFDYIENICIGLMITKTLEIERPIVLFSSAATTLKSVFTSLSWIAILVLVVKWLILKFRKSENLQRKLEEK